MESTIGNLDYASLFKAAPVALAILDQKFQIVTANDAYLRVTGRRRQELVGREYFDVFPPDPYLEDDHRARAQRQTLEAAVISGRPSTMMLHYYPIPRNGRSEDLEPRWWNVTNQPILDDDGRVRLIIRRVEDVSIFGHFEQRGNSSLPMGRESISGLFTYAHEMQRSVDHLQQSVASAHATALAFQQAMLTTPDLESHSNVVVRYQPAAHGLNACGDWYDVANVPDGSLALMVGDVVGHGLAAASMMGMLRSVLNAAIRTGGGPASALETLDLYAQHQEDAVATTTIACQVIPKSQILIHSAAGHLPPLLMHSDGTSIYLHEPNDPPLATRAGHTYSSQNITPYTSGDLLILYTDGLVERRGEDIDVGLARLAATARNLVGRQLDELADTLLSRMANPIGQRDDVCFLLARLK
ncbi:PP2C family protein-serine/threonine phosphatase [Streptomyces sp. 8L]|uniref:PP2C family protein-serine/threonine phosphatase n=1 Tax=Streptomyces sp. 8L TaxID=2877242 RepID=UPI001CD45FA9|nr:SpoIIE family protein phosphatase [Streptomyces sp. 8L]MCA1224291.1 SpoIIE family protein phosphatase [Streptomyces sp. 8L]